MLGMNMLLWTADVGPEHRPVLEMLKRTGYGLVEIPVFHGDPDKCAALAAASRRYWPRSNGAHGARRR